MRLMAGAPPAKTQQLLERFVLNIITVSHMFSTKVLWPSKPRRSRPGLWEGKSSLYWRKGARRSPGQYQTFSFL